MKSFMSSALQDTAPKNNGATECNTCDGGAVRTAGQESAEPAAAPKEEAAKPAPTPEQKENAVVVMQGPLGSVITEALNKSLSKKTNQAAIQIPTPGNESFAYNYVQANGQINDAPMFLEKISKSVGLVPKAGDEPTVINTLLDAVSKVDDVDFILVGKVEADPNPSKVPQKSIIHQVGVDGTVANEELAIESVQVVVTYSKRPKG
jgi:hypothetical protein